MREQLQRPSPEIGIYQRSEVMNIGFAQEDWNQSVKDLIRKEIEKNLTVYVDKDYDYDGTNLKVTIEYDSQLVHSSSVQISRD